MNNAEFVKIGTARVDITPEELRELSGFLVRQQPSLGVHDRLWANCLAIDDGHRKLLWINCDLIGIERATAAEIRREIARRHGIQEDAIIISATHTHSGPATINLLNCGKYDGAYVEKLRGLILEGADEALREFTPAKCGYARGNYQLGMDRRKKERVWTDPTVGVIVWEKQDGTVAAILANYAVHNVGLGPDNREVSGDIEGLAARKLEKMYPAATVLLTNGACGNINPPDHKPDFKLIGSWADGLANEIAKAVEQRRECKGDIETTRDRMDIELEVFSSQQIQKAGEILEREFAHGDKKLAERAKDCVRQWRENISKKYPPDIEAAKTSIDITAVRIGPAGFACFGAEVFSEMTTRLRAAVQENVYVVGYADGDAGYLANEKIYDEGGYEVDTSFIVYNTFRPRRGEFEKACEKAALMMSGLYRGEK